MVSMPHDCSCCGSMRDVNRDTPVTRRSTPASSEARLAMRASVGAHLAADTEHDDVAAEAPKDLDGRGCRLAEEIVELSNGADGLGHQIGCVSPDDLTCPPKPSAKAEGRPLDANYPPFSVAGASTGRGTTRVNWPRCKQLAPLAAAAGDLVFGRADRLLGAARGLDRHQVAIAGRRDEAEQPIVLLLQLDEDDATPGAAEEVDLVRLAEHRAGLARGRDDDLGSR